MVEHEDGGKDESDIVYYQDPERGSVRDQGMQIDLWASKKTPAELQAKIAALDKIYKINMTPPPAESGDNGAYNVPEYEPAPTKVEETPVPKAKAPETKTTEDKKPIPKTTTTTDQKPKATAPTEQKPKPKKIIVE
jgi:serine/threonine-protein kinase